MPIINRLPHGGEVDFSELTPRYIRGTETFSGLTVGHKYVFAISWLNTSGSAKSYEGQGFGTTGLTVEFAMCYGDGVGHNSSQRARGALIVGTATATSVSLTTGMAARACAICVDLDQ